MLGMLWMFVYTYIQYGKSLTVRYLNQLTVRINPAWVPPVCGVVGVYTLGTMVNVVHDWLMLCKTDNEIHYNNSRYVTSRSMWLWISLYGCVLMLSARKHDVCFYEYWIAVWGYGWLGSFSLLRAGVYATELFTWRSTCTSLCYIWHILGICGDVHAAEGMDLLNACPPFTPDCQPVFSCTVLNLSCSAQYMCAGKCAGICIDREQWWNWHENKHRNDPFLCFLGLLINTSIGVALSYPCSIMV